MTRRPRAPARLAVRLGLPLAVILVSLSLAGPRYLPLAIDYLDGESCLGCHRQRNEHLVSQWIDSAHFAAGVDCAGCHGDDHEAIFGAAGEVSAKVCGECHPKEVEELARSGHGRAEEAARESARFLAAPAAMRRQGCLACHEIGRTWPDGSRGRCNDCHSAHRFSAAEARRPQACEGCHMGPDHPQYEAWRASKHGIAYADHPGEEVAPTCVTCHMGGEAGHDTTQALTLGRSSAGAVLAGTPPPIPMKVIDRETFDAGRSTMIAICRRCHSAGFSRRALADADEIKRIADELVAEAAQIIRELRDEGLLDPMPADRPPNPVAGHALVLGGHQLYSDTSPIEQRFFEMSKFHHAITFKGAYHFSPDHTHWLGYAAMQADLTWIRGEARRLRAAGGERP